MDYSKFDLNCPPFAPDADTAFYHPFPSHQAALSAALDCVRSAPGIMLISAAGGLGKTLVTGCLLEQLHRHQRALCLTGAPNQNESITRRLVRGFALEAPSDNVTHRIAQIVQRINIESRGGASFVAVIDDAQHLSNNDIVEITKLMRALAVDNAPLSIVLLATPRFTDRLNQSSTHESGPLITSVRAIEPLRDEQIAHYVRHRLRIAGCGNLELFDTSAMSEIANASRGVPRQINALCDAALRAAGATGADVITVAHVQPAGIPIHLTEEPALNTAIDRPSASEKEAVTDELGRILTEAPQKMAQLHDAVRRLEQRAEMAVSRTGRRLAELKDDSVRHMREMPATGADAQRITEATSQAERVYRRMTQFCDQFAEVSESCEQRLSLLVTSLDAAQVVHEKLETLSESVGELVDDARGSAADERDRLQSMFDEVRARREELSILLESAGKTHAVQLAETNQRTQDELSRIKVSVDTARDEWTQLKSVIDTEVHRTTSLIESINKQVQDRRKQLDEIRDVEQRCVQRAMETAKSAELLSNGLQRANATSQQLEKLTNDIRSAQQAADQVAATLRQILTETDETHARATRTAADARQAATTIDRTNKKLGDNVAAAQRIADHLTDFETSAAQRIDAMIAAAEERIARCVDQAVERIGASVESADQTRAESSRIREAAIAQLDDTARQIQIARNQAVETKGAIDQARVAAVAAVARAQESATAAIKSGAENAIRSLSESAQSGMQAVTAAGDRIDHQLRMFARESLQSVEDAKQAGIKAIQSQAAAETDQARQTIEQDAIDVTKRLSAAGGRQMAQIVAQGETTREELSATTQQITGDLTEWVGRGQSSAEELARQNESARRRCEEVVVATRVLAENLEQSDKCRDAVDRLFRDIWTVATTAETRTRELNALSEQALARNEALRDTIARSSNPAVNLSQKIEQADKTAQTLSNQTQSTHKATVEFTRAIERAKYVNRKMESLIQHGAAVRDELDERAPQLVEAVQLAQDLIETIKSESDTARRTSDAVASLTEETHKVRERLIGVQRSLADPAAMIRDAKAQAEELNGICLSVKRIFGAVSRTLLDANDRIKALHALMTGSQNAQTMLEQWVAEANVTQQRLASTVQSAPPIGQTHPVVVIPDAMDQPLPEILKAATGELNMRGNARPMAAGTERRASISANKTHRLSPQDIRSMIADAKANVRNKELSAIK